MKMRDLKPIKFLYNAKNLTDEKYFEKHLERNSFWLICEQKFKYKVKT